MYDQDLEDHRHQHDAAKEGISMHCGEHVNRGRRRLATIGLKRTDPRIEYLGRLKEKESRQRDR